MLRRWKGEGAMSSEGYRTGVQNAEEHFVKARLVFKIDTQVKQGGLKQIEAEPLGDRSNASALHVS
jgi:hypothetical protein